MGELKKIIIHKKKLSHSTYLIINDIVNWQMSDWKKYHKEHPSKYTSILLERATQALSEIKLLTQP